MSRIDEVRQWSVKALGEYNFWNPSMGSLEDVVEGRILASSPHADNHLLRTKHLDYEMLQLLYLAGVDELWSYPAGRQLNQKLLERSVNGGEAESAAVRRFVGEPTATCPCPGTVEEAIRWVHMVSSMVGEPA